MRIRRFQVSLLVLVAVGFLGLSGCGGGSEDLPKASIPPSNSARNSTFSTARTGDGDAEPVQLTGLERAGTPPTETPAAVPTEVLIKTSKGDIRLRLNREKAPRTVENFLYNYVERGFYAQTIVHFVDPGYMIAAGGYDAKYQHKEPRTAILCEANNGVKNLKGTIAMAHDPDYVNSATSQFFINLVDNPGLDHEPQEDEIVNGYCVFGEVIEGMDVVEAIALVDVHDKGEFANTPVEPVVILGVQRVR